MANQATTNYKVTGSRKAVSDLWAALQGMKVNTKNIWLDELAKYYGIDYEAKHISVRGHIYWAEFEEDDDHVLLSFDTESAWDACNELFEEINHLLWDELSISYRVGFGWFLNVSGYRQERLHPSHGYRDEIFFHRDDRNLSSR